MAPSTQLQFSLLGRGRVQNADFNNDFDLIGVSMGETSVASS